MKLPSETWIFTYTLSFLLNLSRAWYARRRATPRARRDWETRELSSHFYRDSAGEWLERRETRLRRNSIWQNSVYSKIILVPTALSPQVAFLSQKQLLFQLVANRKPSIPWVSKDDRKPVLIFSSIVFRLIFPTGKWTDKFNTGRISDEFSVISRLRRFSVSNMNSAIDSKPALLVNASENGGIFFKIGQWQWK